jgi:hypothetical protein
MFYLTFHEELGCYTQFIGECTLKGQCLVFSSNIAGAASGELAMQTWFKIT